MTMTQPQADLNSYVQDLHDDYIFFVKEIWRYTGLDKLAPIDPMEEDILVWVAGGGEIPNRRGVLAPRGLGKTTWGTASKACHELFKNPNAKVVIVSKSEGHAKKIVTLIRGWLRVVPFLRFLAPRPPENDRYWRDNTDMFDCGPMMPSKDPSVWAVGIDGQLAGPRGSIVIADDVESPENVRTQDARDRLDYAVREFTSMATYGKREILYFGTYHHEQSLYIKLAERGYVFRTWPLLYPEPSDKILGLAPSLRDLLDRKVKKAGEPVFDRHDATYIAERKAEGRVHFAMQQMLIANLGDTEMYPLQLRDLIIFPVNRDKCPISIAWGTSNDRKAGGTRIEDIPCFGLDGDGLYEPINYDDNWAPYARTIMWIDPAKGKVGGDELAYAIVSLAFGYLWVKTVGAIPNGRATAENLDSLVLLAREHRAREIHVEDFALQSYFAELLEPVVHRHAIPPGERDEFPTGWNAAVLCTKPPMPQSQKELRIIGVLDPLFQQHRVVMDRRTIESESLQHQITRITRQRDCLTQDGQVDALANACAVFQEDMHIDPEKAADRQRERELQDELDRFFAGNVGGRGFTTFGGRPKPLSFLTRHS